MIRLLTAFILLVLSGGISFAQIGAQTGVRQPLPDMLYQYRDGQAPGAITPQIFRNDAVSNSPATYDPRNYGAVCDGSHRSITATLGLSTKATIAAYTSPSGATPYSWITNAIWNGTAPLRLAVDGANTNTTLFVRGAVGVPTGAALSGTQIPGGVTVSSVSNPATVSRTMTGSTISSNGTKTLPMTTTTGIIVGSHPTPQTGLSSDDWVVTVNANTSIVMEWGTTGTITNGTSLTFQPPSSIVMTGGTLNGAKASDTNVTTGSTTSSNYWVYAQWNSTDAMAAAAEMDWLGIEAAIQAANATTPPGRVILPSGTCIMDNATVAGNWYGSLIVPYTNGNNASFVGQGNVSTILSWPSDLGSSRIGMSYDINSGTWDNATARYTNPGRQYGGETSDLQLLGPSPGGPVLGIWFGPNTVQMDGTSTGSRRQFDRLLVQGFHNGIVRDSLDHTRWSDIQTYLNVNGLYEAPTNINSGGNNEIDHWESANNAESGWSIDKDGSFLSSDTHNLFLGVEPKGMRIEPGTNSTYPGSTGALLSSNAFTGVFGEGLGDGFIVIDAYGPLFSCCQNDPQFLGTEWRINDLNQNNTWLPAGDRFNYWIAQGVASGNRYTFDGGFSNPATELGFMHFNYPEQGGGGEMINVTNLEGNLGVYSGATPFVAANTGSGLQTYYEIHLCDVGRWCGHYELYKSATTATLGMLLDYTTGGSSWDLNVEPSGGSAPFAGVNMIAGTTTGQLTIVATKFCSTQYTNTIPTSGTATALHWGKLAAGGTVTNASGPDTAGEVVIGTIMEVTGTAARMNIGNNGSCD